jgi:hypothetical protein
VVSTLLSAVPALYSLVRHRRVDGLSTYFTAMMLGGRVQDPRSPLRRGSAGDDGH